MRSVRWRIPGVLRTDPRQKTCWKSNPLDTFHKLCPSAVYLKEDSRGFWVTGNFIDFSLTFKNELLEVFNEFRHTDVLVVHILINAFFTFNLNTISRRALCVPDAEVFIPVKALFAATDPVGGRGTLGFHLLVAHAKVAAVQTLRQVVPQLGEVATSARYALRGHAGGAVSGHVSARWTLFAGYDLFG